MHNKDNISKAIITSIINNGNFTEYLFCLLSNLGDEEWRVDDSVHLGNFPKLL